MLVARVYSVMDRIVVEVSCVHGHDAPGSHLVIREERSGVTVDQAGALRALADVADTAALITRSQYRPLEPGQIEDCERGWVSPSG